MATITVTTDDVGESLATDGTLTGIEVTAVPTGYREANFTLIDATTEQVLYNVDLSTAAVSAESVLLENGNIAFADLTLESLAPGTELTLTTA